ncbi:MAG: LysR family transcriptional regulator, partial [Ruminococcus sp.]|nr:LysR family transcriptional regulator [Ruminococcus sp.]
MKIQHLEYVLAIAQEGSITKAAKKLYQAQPNI